MKKLFTWIGSVLSSQLFRILLLQILVTIGLIYLTEIWLNESNIRLAVELGIAALGFFAASQTFIISSNLRDYISRDLLTGLASSKGIVVNGARITKSFKEILPGDEYTVQFSFEGYQLIQVPVSKTVRPALLMAPPLFLSDTTESNEKGTVWFGSPISFTSKKESGWELKGQVGFNTHKINSMVEDASFATLTLQLRTEDGVLLNLSLDRTPVHLMSLAEIFQELIHLRTIMKLPSGYHVLAVSKDRAFHTNLVFLCERFQELKSDRKFSDRTRRIQAAIARYVNVTFREIQTRNPSKRLTLFGYEPVEYENELNSSSVLRDILGDITLAQQVSQTDKVLVAIHQTPEFMVQVERRGGLGIALFGFGQITPNNVRVIFDLDRLELSQDTINNPCAVGHTELHLLSETSSEHFEKYAHQLRVVLTQAPRDVALSTQIEVPTTSSSQKKQGTTLEDLLRVLRVPAEASLRHGRFVNSEPAIASYWINLRIFEDAIQKIGLQNALENALVSVIDRIAKNYGNNFSKLYVLNLCSEGSGIANELPTLWQFKHPSLPTGAVAIDSPSKSITLPQDITDVNAPNDIILLAPFDSYVITLDMVIKSVRAYNNNVICVLCLFSIAETWDYLTAFDYFDVLSLFRVHPLYPTGLTPLTSMADYKRTKPWLFQTM